MKPPAEPAHPYTPQNQSGNAPQQEELSLAVQMVFIGRKHRMIAGIEMESSSIGWSISESSICEASSHAGIGKGKILFPHLLIF